MSTPTPTIVPAFLSVGEIVGLSFRLYRHYFSTYSRLLKRHKGQAASLFARLVFCELQGQQEPIEAALKQSVARKKLYSLAYQQVYWKLAIKALIIGVPVFVVGSILLLILSELATLLLGYSLAPFLEQAYPIGFPLGGVGLAVASQRFYLVEPIAFLEHDLQSAESILDRATSLAKHSSKRIFATHLLAMLTIWPLSIPYFALTSLFLFLMAADQDTAIKTLVYDVASWIGFFLVSMLWVRIVGPLHSILKIVLYRDVCSRQEGSDLSLVNC